MREVNSKEMSSLFKMSNLSVQYDVEGKKIAALDGVSFEIPSTKYSLGIVGESGSGKTTLGLAMMNVIEPPGKIATGSIEYEGKKILELNKNQLRDYRWKEIAMVYQSAMNSLNPVKPISNPIVEVLREHRRADKKEAEETALKLLSQFGIKPERANDFPHELSGGMRQRVVIALALALSPKILIADEPTSALDVVIQKQILSVLKREMSQKNLSLIFITHEISLLSGLVDNVAVMYGGEIVETGPIDKVLFEPLHPYTEMLLSTLLTLDSHDEQDDASAQNKLPKDAKTPSGSTTRIERVASLPRLPKNACKYANRCKYAFDRCRVEHPPLLDIGNGRKVACHKYN